MTGFRMKWMSAVTAVLLGAGGAAQGAVQGYDPYDDELPGAAGFALTGNDFITGVSGGFAATTIVPSSGNWRFNSAGFSNATGWTVDTRFQIDPNNTAGQRAIGLLVREPGGGQLELEIKKGSFFVAGEGAGVLGSEQFVTLSDSFHTLRLTRLGTNVRAYLDDNPTPLVNATFSQTQDFGGNFLFWGRVGGDNAGSAVVDFIQFDNTQALQAPPGTEAGHNVPEPAAAALLVLGTMALLRRRR